jgi:hypothetical protein
LANENIDAYGGALLFIAFLSEMRHPADFWKGLFVAQLFISIVYIIFGALVSLVALLFISFEERALANGRRRKGLFAIWSILHLINIAEHYSYARLANSFERFCLGNWCHRML